MTCGGIVYGALNAYYFPEEWKEYTKAMWKNVQHDLEDRGLI